VTEQFVANGLLLETLGAMVCGFRLRADAEGLFYAQEYQAVRVGRFRLRLPGWLGPSVVARVVRRERAAYSEVEIALPLVGLILRYEGSVTAVRSEASELK
jgi:hypothetical protein